MSIKNNLIIILSFLLTILFVPESNCQIEIDTSVYFISARSGLILREAPTVNSKKIISGKYGQAVQSIEIGSEEIKLDDKKGSWIKVNLDGNIGFMFSAYLSKLPRLDNKSSNNPINNGHLGLPAGDLSEYFRLVLTEIGERKTNIIKGCGDDPDCKNGISQEIRFMDKGFTYTETKGWELYEEDILGINWSYDDAKDLVDWIVYPLYENDVQLHIGENSCTYTDCRDNNYGSAMDITIKKIADGQTSIHWGIFH